MARRRRATKEKDQVGGGKGAVLEEPMVSPTKKPKGRATRAGAGKKNLNPPTVGKRGEQELDSTSTCDEPKSKVDQLDKLEQYLDNDAQSSNKDPKNGETGENESAPVQIQPPKSPATRKSSRIQAKKTDAVPSSATIVSSQRKSTRGRKRKATASPPRVRLDYLNDSTEPTGSQEDGQGLMENSSNQAGNLDGQSSSSSAAAALGSQMDAGPAVQSHVDPTPSTSQVPSGNELPDGVKFRKIKKEVVYDDEGPYSVDLSCVKQEIVFNEEVVEDNHMREAEIMTRQWQQNKPVSQSPALKLMGEIKEGQDVTVERNLLHRDHGKTLAGKIVPDEELTAQAGQLIPYAPPPPSPSHYSASPSSSALSVSQCQPLSVALRESYYVVDSVKDKAIFDKPQGFLIKSALMNYHKLSTEDVPELKRALDLQRAYNSSLQKTLRSMHGLQERLIEENNHLRGQTSSLLVISEKERFRAEEAWKRVDQTALYNKAREQGAEQRFFLKNKYEQAVEKVKSSYESRFKAIENDRSKLAKENEVLNRKLSKKAKMVKRTKKTNENLQRIVQAATKVLESFLGESTVEIMKRNLKDPEVLEVFCESLNVELDAAEIVADWITALGVHDRLELMQEQNHALDESHDEGEQEIKLLGIEDGDSNTLSGSEGDEDLDEEGFEEVLTECINHAYSKEDIQANDDQMNQSSLTDSLFEPDLGLQEVVLTNEDPKGKIDSISCALLQHENTSQQKSSEIDDVSSIFEPVVGSAPIITTTSESTVYDEPIGFGYMGPLSECGSSQPIPSLRDLIEQGSELTSQSTLSDSQEDSAITVPIFTEREIATETAECEQESVAKISVLADIEIQSDTATITAEPSGSQVLTELQNTEVTEEVDAISHHVGTPNKLDSPRHMSKLLDPEVEYVDHWDSDSNEDPTPPIVIFSPKSGRQKRAKQRRERGREKRWRRGEPERKHESVREKLIRENDILPVQATCDKSKLDQHVREKLEELRKKKTSSGKDSTSEAEGKDEKAHEDSKAPTTDGENKRKRSRDSSEKANQESKPSRKRAKTQYSFEELFGPDDGGPNDRPAPPLPQSSSKAERDLSSISSSSSSSSSDSESDNEKGSNEEYSMKMLGKDLQLSESESDAEERGPASPEPEKEASQSEPQWVLETDDATMRNLRELMKLEVEELFNNPFHIQNFVHTSVQKLVPCFYKLVAETTNRSLHEPTTTYDSLTRCPLNPRFLTMYAVMKKLETVYPHLSNDFLHFLEEILEDDFRRELERDTLLIHFGRFVGALSLDGKLSDMALRTIFAFGLYRGPLIFPYAFGVLCSDSTVFGYCVNGFSDLDIESRALIFTLVRNVRWGNSKTSGAVVDLLVKSLLFDVPEMSFEAFFDSILEEFKKLESQREIERYAKVLSLLCVQNGWVWFSKKVGELTSNWILDWQKNVVSDGVLSGLLEGVIGGTCKCMRRIDLPDDVTTIRNVLLTVTKIDAVPDIVSGAAHSAIRQIDSIHTRGKNSKTEVWHYEKRSWGGRGRGNNQRGRGSGRGRGGNWVRGNASVNNRGGSGNDRARDRSSGERRSWEGGNGGRGRSPRGGPQRRGGGRGGGGRGQPHHNHRGRDRGTSRRN